MSSAGRKIASETVKNRRSTPFFEWLRRKLLAVERDPRTPPPGVSKEGEYIYYPHNRFPNTQSCRSPDPPSIPGGVHHKLSDNYYLDRDARRSVDPPKLVYANGNSIEKFNKSLNQTETRTAAALTASTTQTVNIGPVNNFGIKVSIPTPGFGFEWKRSKENEAEDRKNDKNLKIFESFDSYRK